MDSEALKGRVFDILGEVFEETSVKALLIQAIRYGDQPEVRLRLTRNIDQALDRNALARLSPASSKRRSFLTCPSLIIANYFG